ncbi:MAG: response regulator [Planctomycetota bacterium]|jgi:signal transduction histidine kinase/CheY-like chemotaxis protein|nr:response regulator [Planctomycetota bacterium]
MKERRRYLAFGAWGALVLAGIFLLYYSARENINRACERAIIDRHEQKCSLLEAVYNREITLARLLSESEAAIAYCSLPVGSPARLAAAERIRSFSRFITSREVFWCAAADMMFNIVDDDEITSYKVKPDAPENYWWYLTTMSGQPYNVNINFNLDLGKINVWINAPVLAPDGKALGLVGAGIDINEVLRGIYDQVAPGIQIVLFNGNYEVTIDRDIANIVAKRHIFAVAPDSPQFISTYAGPLRQKQIEGARRRPEWYADQTQHIVKRDERSIEALSYMPTLNWYMYSSLPLTWSMLAERGFVEMPLTTYKGLVVLWLAIAALGFWAIGQNWRLSALMRKTAEVSQMKSHFVSLVSHEMLTPINAITGVAALVKQENPPEKIRQYATDIAAAADRLLSMVNNAIDLTQFEGGKITPQNQPYQLRSLLFDVISRLRAKLGEKPLWLAVSVDPQLPRTLRGDAARLRRILCVIADNAVKYTAEGSITLTARGKWGNGKFSLIIDIADTGVGMSADEAGQIFSFDKLFRSRSMRMSHHGEHGAGLALATVHSWAQAMGGEITVTTAVAKGSVFTTRFPQTVVNREPLARAARAADCRALVIEPRELLRASLADALKALNVAVEAVGDLRMVGETVRARPFSHIFVATKIWNAAMTVLNAAYKNHSDSFAPRCVLCRMVEISALSGVENDGASPQPIFPARVETVELPLWAEPLTRLLDDPAPAGAETPDANNFADWTAPRARILAVDDMQMNLLVVRGLLKKRGAQVCECLSGKEALEKVRAAAATGENFHLVLLDYMMPEMDGMETLTRLLEIDPQLRVVVLTASLDENVREQFFRQGAVGYLNKPVYANLLNEILLEHLPPAVVERR